MGSKKALLIGAAALAFNAGQAESSNLPENTENTKKDITKNIIHTQKKHKASQLDLGKLLSEASKNQGEVDKVIQMRSEADTNISDIEVHKKLKYIEFMYKERYKIKYDPEQDKSLDRITVTDSVTQTTQEIKIKTSLFLDNLMPKNKKEYKTQLKERLERIIKIYDDIYEYIAKNDLVVDETEMIYVIGDKVYFTAEDKSEETYYFTLTYAKEPKEWEEYNVKKVNEEGSDWRFNAIGSM